MGKLSFLLKFAFLVVPVGASASYKCKTADAKTEVSVATSFELGEIAKVQSEEISKFYEGSGLKISILDSVIDPETGRAVSEALSRDEVSYLLSAPNSGTQTVWNMTFSRAKTADANRFNAVIVDQLGNTFRYDLTCEAGGDLE